MAGKRYIVVTGEGKVAHGPSSEAKCNTWATRAMHERGGAYFVEPIEPKTLPAVLAAQRATHMQLFPTGARLEFRPGARGGWASRAVTAAGADNWIYYGPELPKGAREVVMTDKTTAELDREIEAHARKVSERAAAERAERKGRRYRGVRAGGRRDV